MHRLVAVAALAGVAAAVLVVVLRGEERRAPEARAAAPVAFTAAVASPRSFRAEAARRAELRASWERRERTDEHVFPIRGRHDRGRYETNDFGGGRGHQGQDMFADCGTPLVAALGGVVKRAGTEGAGGNYVVIAGKDRRDYVYMHLAEPPPVKDGQRVESGQSIGRVGDSGNADGCHLHFELWTAPGWYAGGEPIDTAKLLAAWDAAS
ncbi:M23 family metallopeptidase [Conexibacter stalactiti]|uniref:M23 family metallopeptidase n=1 Tax=Conexibacter stalactiti TaxID=1940611 RepID=A0ABU4HXN9_9ACTN|nr:M23 family metallopeptidase [Conexibacter stalactiti]MDW5598097.1 M23 family metallopeptidase [Conexibacter stalactiti]MEC5038739.1 M23 family metallopeptidase [Conexibacter stalactiti]